MSIPIECPACEHLFSVPLRYGGRKGKCPECGTVFDVPKAAADDDLRPRPSARPPTPPTDGESVAARLRIPLPNKVAQRVPTRIPEVPPVCTVDRDASNDPVASEPAENPFTTYVNTSDQAPKPPIQPAGQAPPLPRHYARRSNAPLFAATGVLVIFVVVGFIGIVILNPFAKKPHPSDDAPVAQDNTNGGQPNDNANTQAKSSKSRMPTDDELRTLWQETLPFICQVFIDAPNGTTTVAGFVIDSRGWIATNYFAVKDARNVRVRFGAADESTNPIEATGIGIVASSPVHDLAIIAIERKDTDRFRGPMLNTEYDPVEGDYMVAVGWAADGNGLYAHSQIKRLVATALLPPSNYAYLRERHLNDLDDLSLIEHSREVIDGVGGGPLLNLKGEAIGVNVQLSPTATSGYAIPIKYLVALNGSASGEITPFANAAPVATNPIPTPAINPMTKIKTGTWESIDLMTKLLEQGKSTSWLPRAAAEYEELQRLARHVTDAKTIKDDKTIEEGLRDFLDVRSQEVLDALGDMQWKAEAELAEVNQLATAGLASPEPGLFAFGRVVIPSASSQKLDDKPTVVFELIGTDTWVVLTVGENAGTLQKGTRWLILGVRDEEANIAITTNPGEPEKVVSLIHSKFLVSDKPPPVDE